MESPSEVLHYGGAIPLQALPAENSGQDVMKLEVFIKEAISPHEFYFVLDETLVDKLEQNMNLDYIFEKHSPRNIDFKKVIVEQIMLGETLCLIGKNCSIKKTQEPTADWNGLNLFTVMLASLVYQTEKYKIPKECLRKDMLCAANSDSSWHRAKVLEVHDGIANIQYIDYGTPGTSECSNLRFLLNHFAKLPAQAICGKLIGVKPKNGQSRFDRKVKAEFWKMVCYKKLTAHVYQETANVFNKEKITPLEIILLEGEMKFNDHLIRTGMASPIPPVMTPEKLPKTYVVHNYYCSYPPTMGLPVPYSQPLPNPLYQPDVHCLPYPQYPPVVLQQQPLPLIHFPPDQMSLHPPYLVNQAMQPRYQNFPPSGNIIPHCSPFPSSSYPTSGLPNPSPSWIGLLDHPFASSVSAPTTIPQPPRKYEGKRIQQKKKGK